MMQMMQQGMMGMGQQQQSAQQQRYEDLKEQKEEYREDAKYQQGRIDHTQDSALNYTTRVTESSQESNPNITINANVPTAQPVFCPSCGGKATTADKNCPHCGEPLDL